jgi:hypothetical protein
LALEFLQQAEQTLERAMLACRREQERKRREAEAAARDTANKEAERLRRLAEQAGTERQRAVVDIDASR